MRETPTRPHGIQLFDDAESLGAGVAAFVREGLVQNDCVLVVTSPRHWSSIDSALRKDRTDVDAFRDAGMLVVADSQEMLGRFLRRGRPDEALFKAAIGPAIQALIRRGSGLRVYGDMVDILAAEGNLRAAIQLEELWNSLLRENAFSLFCGYSASSFGHPRDARQLSEICHLHTDVHSSPRDVLGGFLVREHIDRPASPEA
jgi:hypothetical protein